MILRKLEKEEHGKTRLLWERIFTEDTPEFLDYYYSEKTAENEIYVIEEDGAVRSMLHLNPYQVNVGRETRECHYIVAVATEEPYRGRGYMAKLLARACEEMRENGEPFTFLMPAAEAIYYPHGFRYVYRQKKELVTGMRMPDAGWETAPAEKADCAGLAELANRILEEKYDVFAKRDVRYYERLLAECQSGNGGVFLVKKEGTVAGFFSWIREEAYEIMEPLFMSGCEEALAYGVYSLTGNEETSVRCSGRNGEEKPLIMAKILDIPAMFGCMEASEETGFWLEVLDAPDGRFLGEYFVSGREKLSVKKPGAELRAAFAGAYAERIDIGLLTSLLFGYEDLEKADISKELKRELGKIKPLRRIFLNEIV